MYSSLLRGKYYIYYYIILYIYLCINYSHCICEDNIDCNIDTPLHRRALNRIPNSSFHDLPIPMLKPQLQWSKSMYLARSLS